MSDTETAKRIAKKLARVLFEVGDELDAQTDRMAFIGVVDGKERMQGGMCEKALVSFIQRNIGEIMSDTDDTPTLKTAFIHWKSIEVDKLRAEVAELKERLQAISVDTSAYRRITELEVEASQLRMKERKAQESNHSLRGLVKRLEQELVCSDVLASQGTNFSWISVDKGLPKGANQVEVVFYCRPYEWLTGMYTQPGFVDADGGFQYYDTRKDCYFDPNGDVVAWMKLPNPLPAPPEAKQ